MAHCLEKSPKLLELFDLAVVLLYIVTMRQGTGHPAEQLKVFLTGLVNPCTMDFVSAKGSTLAW